MSAGVIDMNIFLIDTKPIEAMNSQLGALPSYEYKIFYVGSQIQTHTVKISTKEIVCYIAKKRIKCYTSLKMLKFSRCLDANGTILRDKTIYKVNLIFTLRAKCQLEL